MNKIFKHKVQPTTVYNPTELLAKEVADGFNKVEDELYKDDTKSASLVSSIGDMDNKYIKDYSPNRGYLNNYRQQLYFPNKSQDAMLDLYPSVTDSDLNLVTVTSSSTPSKIFTYKKDGVLKSNTDYTFIGRKVIFGGLTTVDDTLIITYRGFNTTTPDDNDSYPFDLRYNVLKINNSTEIPVSKQGSTYTISGIDLKEHLSNNLLNILEKDVDSLSRYIAIYSKDTRVNTTSLSITRGAVSFSTDDSISDTVKVYAANSTLADLIEGLYRLFYAHNHGADGGNGIAHKDLLSLYTNTDKVQYLYPNKTNYDHPQYLNREGYVDDSGIYNNSILGDILLGSTSSANRYNNIDSDSVKLVFGDYASGHKIYYNKNQDSLVIDSVSKNGVKLSTPSNKDILNLNDHSFVNTTNQGSNTLKLKLVTTGSDSNGILQLTRKRIENNVEKEDDYALLMSYGIEASNISLKKQLLLKDGSFLSFGSDDEKSTVGREGNNLVFNTASVSGRVIFNAPLTATNVKIKHLDSDLIHITKDQIIGFGFNDDAGIYAKQYINYENDSLNFKTTNSVRIQTTGRKKGLSLNDRTYIYVSTAAGNSPASDTDTTDLYIESEKDVYFLKKNYRWLTETENSLQKGVDKTNIYTNETNSSNFIVAYDPTKTNSLVLNDDNKIFTQKLNNSSFPTIVQSPYGLVSATNYDINTRSITYGKIYGSSIYAKGEGFFGNVTISPNNKLQVDGDVVFTNEITFGQTTTFSKKVITPLVQADAVNVKTLTVSDMANYTNISCKNITIDTDLKFNSMTQTSRFATSTFEGSVVFNNNVVMPTNYFSITLGNTDIEQTRKVSGLRLTPTDVKLGTSGLVSSGKVIAGKGSPSGKGDRTGGYSFATTNGDPVGDTGFFCEGNIEATTGSDLVFRIDGVEKGRVPNTPADLSFGTILGKEKHLVTLDQMYSSLEDVRSDVLDRVYPIGTIYSNSVDGRNPTTILNWSSSVWRRYSVGRSLMGAAGFGANEGADSFLTPPSDLSLTVAGTKYGDYTHVLTTDELPQHNHVNDKVFNKLSARAKDVIDQYSYTGYDTTNRGLTPGSFDNQSADVEMMVGAYTQQYWDKSVIANVGSDKPHTVVQPVIVTHMWERIA